MANTPAPSDLPPPLERLYPPKTPSKDPLPDAIARINALISTSRAAWLGLLSYLAFIGVTLLGVEDADFFITERQTDLPLIGVAVPTNLFFAIAPALGAMLATYLHLYLVKLWEALAEAPLPDTDPSLADRIQPWELADFALSFRKGARTVETRPLGRLAWIVSLTLAFAATPAVLAAFWWRSMPKHDEALTVICCGIPLSFALYSATSSFLRLRRIMKGDDRPLFPTWRARGGWWAGFLGLAVMGWLTTEGTFKAYAEFPFVPVFESPETRWQLKSPADISRKTLESKLLELARRGELKSYFVSLSESYAKVLRQQFSNEANLGAVREAQLARLSSSAAESDISEEIERQLANTWWSQTWFPFLLVGADLRGANFSYISDGWLDYDQAKVAFHRNWCAANDLSPAVCGPIPDRDKELTPHQSAARQEWCAKSLPPEVLGSMEEGTEPCKKYFATWEAGFDTAWKDFRRLERAGLKRRSLAGADLRGADLRDAILIGTNLESARLEGADLRDSRVEAAIFRRARFFGAHLGRARMEGADFACSYGAGANFANARLIGATFVLGIFDGAYFRDSEMEEVNLRGGSFENAVFRSSKIFSGDLTSAKLYSADLGWARLEDAKFENTLLSGASLRSAALDGASFLRTNVDKATSLHGASLLGATAIDVDFSSLTLSIDQIWSMVGDSSVALPNGITPGHLDWPPNWSVISEPWEAVDTSESFVSDWPVGQIGHEEDPVSSSYFTDCATYLPPF